MGIGLGLMTSLLNLGLGISPIMVTHYKNIGNGD